MTGRSCCRLQGLKRWLRRFAPFCIGDYPLARSRELAIERISNRFAIGLAAALSLFALCSCQSLKRAAAPVVIYDAKVSERDCIGVEFTAVNLCGRPVKSLSFRACVSQKEGGEGDALDFEFYEAFWTLDGGLDAGEERTVFVPLEDAPPDCEADGLEIENVLVESAVFEDGGWWRRKN